MKKVAGLADPVPHILQSVGLQCCHPRAKPFSRLIRPAGSGLVVEALCVAVRRKLRFDRGVKGKVLPTSRFPEEAFLPPQRRSQTPVSHRRSTVKLDKKLSAAAPLPASASANWI